MNLSYWNEWTKVAAGDDNEAYHDGMYQFHGSLNLQATTFAKYIEMGFCFQLDFEEDDKNQKENSIYKFDCYQNKFSADPDVPNCLVQDAKKINLDQIAENWDWSLDSDASVIDDPSKNWVANSHDEITDKCYTITDKGNN